MSSFQLLSLDLDDTLWDSEPVLRRAVEAQYAWLRRHCPRVTAHYSSAQLEELRELFLERSPHLQHDFSASRREFFAELFVAFDYDPALAATLLTQFIAVRSRVTLLDDVRDTLPALQRDYRLAAVTNGNADLAQAGLRHFFAHVVSPAESGAAKPDPRMFQHLFAAAGIAPAHVVHVGDQPYYDIEAAHRAGIACVWINRGGTVWPDGIRPADVEIRLFTELPAALDAIRRRRFAS
ncbi:MAG: HAD family hydrolase [Gammaproteobacteria bacterium]|nr:HAD family hydrolase [Gammaproteobacteria bacterium]